MRGERRLKMDRKGLSDVVTTVLIILLVLAAVVIIWSFIQPAIKRSASQVTGDCINLKIEPVSCNSTRLVYKRDAGTANLKDVMFVFGQGGIDNVRNLSNSNIDELESKSVLVFNTFAPEITINARDTFTVAGVIQTASGELIICTEAEPRITCTAP